jgi:hypothetical protein
MSCTLPPLIGMPIVLCHRQVVTHAGTIAHNFGPGRCQFDQNYEHEHEHEFDMYEVHADVDTSLQQTKEDYM